MKGMKAKTQLPADADGKPKKHSAWRALRAQRRKAYYAQRPYATMAAKKRTLGRQLRRFPEDLQAAALYAKKHGEAACEAQLNRCCSKARKRINRTARARSVMHGN
jgi:hypothetical protein